ncbi:unnamed protein product [Cladocopium goreaui]|uniref:Uncharacterized protein n=1 Tax=Cladocopium goreaui TaxID=2562237 RepID=A0A9P1DLK5_9DINO|nr:unnamed protein product [Cladocopium goreaui]|mmetsp:Transcript_66881/g.146606  ORF Transcript_66881/g.146606 Transcript_66881/m.146606 type:complete len:131 (-) Transcript_66881:61-453(-)
MALPDEVFKQRLYELAKENEPKPAEAEKVEPVTSGDAALEGMLNDLLAALRKEQLKDPLTEEQVTRTNEAAEAAVKSKALAESQGYASDTIKAEAAEGDAPGPSAGLLAALRMAGDMMKGPGDAEQTAQK